MRTNLPVTNVEYPIHDDTLIVSKTDTKGRLTYFNDQFVDAAGFTEAELIGQPHNIIRHPDMPPEAFEDLWMTLKAGKPWAGAVKNRRKNGDFYWVLASATPIWESGQISGFMSIRSKIPDSQRAEAEHVYALMRAKKASSYTVSAGIIRRRSFADRFGFFKRTLRARLLTLIMVQMAFMIAIGSVGIFANFGSENVVLLGIQIATLIAGLVIGTLLGFQAIGAIIRPLGRLIDAMAKIAQGEFNSRIVIERDDEIGTALRNIQAMQNKLGFDREETKDTEKKVALQRKLDMHQLANNFEGAVGKIIETVSHASSELETSAVMLSANAERSKELTTTVAGASEIASTNVQSVASATEEMAASVNEIGRQVQDSARIANAAVLQAQQTNEQIGQLSSAAARIGDVVETDHDHRGTDKFAASQRDHRGSACRRCRSRLRGRCIRGESACCTDGGRDQRDQSADHRHSGRDHGICLVHQGDRPDDREHVRHRLSNRRCGGTARQRNERNCLQRSAGRSGHDPSLRQYRRRTARCQRDRHGFCPRPVGRPIHVKRKQPPEGRSRQLSEHGTGCLVEWI